VKRFLKTMVNLRLLAVLLVVAYGAFSGVGAAAAASVPPLGAASESAKPDVIPELPEAASYVAGSDETGEVIEVAEEEVPLGTVDHGVDAAKTIEEDEAPLGTLPQTGESGPLPFYLFGSALAVFGVCLLRKKRVN